MEKLVQTNSWTPNAIDSTPAGSETLTAYRTVHGVVYARGKVHGQEGGLRARPHAPTSTRRTAVIGFSQLNDPGFMTGPAAFKQAVAEHQLPLQLGLHRLRSTSPTRSPGECPQRAKGTSPDFPVFGTGKYDWRGYNPATHEAERLPLHKPSAGGRPALPRLLEQQAGPGWASADDKYTYGLAAPLADDQRQGRAGDEGGRKMTIAQLVQAMEEPATPGPARLPDPAPRLQARSASRPRTWRAAVGQLRAWVKAGAHRRDLDKDGSMSTTPRWRRWTPGGRCWSRPSSSR